MKQNSCLFILAFFVQTFSVYSQTNAIDSLKLLLQTEKQDSTRCLLFSQLSGQYQYNKPDTALLLAQQGLALARQIHFVRGEADCLCQTGAIFLLMGDDAKGLDLFLQALRKSESITDRKIMVRTLNDIGYVYSDQGDETKSLDYDLKAREISTFLKDEHLLLTNLINIGDNYEKLNQLDSARTYTNMAYDLAIKEKDPENIGITLNNLGNIYSKMKQPAVAMDNYRMSITYDMKANDDDGICESTLGMAKLFLQQRQDDSSLKYAKISFSIGKKDGFTQRISNASNFLADYYKQHHVVDSAYAYLSAVITAKDSLFSQQKLNEIKTLSFDETMRQQEIAADKVAVELEHKKNLQTIGITAGLIIFLILFLVISQSLIVNERWIKFLGIIGLLIVFEYIYLLLDPYIVKFTSESPVWMFVILVALAVILEPIHNRVEYWITYKVVSKNKLLRLAAAKKTVARLEAEKNEEKSNN